MELVSWEFVCQPRSWGHGFRRLEDQNTSFLMKLGSNVVSNSNALWVHVLKSKYRVLTGSPESLIQGSCSFFLEAFLKSSHLS